MTKVVKPLYPDLLKEAELEGTVVLQAVITEDGKVDPRFLKVIRSLHPLLDAASLEALSASEFSPARLEGRPVRVIMQIPYTYRFKPSKRVPVPISSAVGSGGRMPVQAQYTRPMILHQLAADSAGQLGYARAQVKAIQIWRRNVETDPSLQGGDAFSPTDTLWATLEIESVRKDTPVFARWIYRGPGGERVITESRPRAEAEGRVTLDVFAAKATPWPEGDYELRAGVGPLTDASARFRVQR